MTGRARPDWQSARKILCIRLDSLGDVLMTTPALRALQAGRPDRRLTLLTSPSGAAVAGLVPPVAETIVYEAPWLKATPLRTSSAQDLAMVARLKQARFDAAVIFTVFSQNPLPSALLAYLADIPLRLAYCRENPYQLLTDWVPETDSAGPDGMRHEVRRQLDLVAQAGCTISDERLSIRVSDAARVRARTAARQAGLDLACPWVLIHPGATAPSRRYAPERFARAALSLRREHGLQVAFSGSEQERELVEEIRQAMGAPSVSLVGQLDLEALAALIETAPLLITNNTGPAHLAAAVGTPVVDLYAQTNPQHTPWGVPHRLLFFDVPCKNCFKSVCPLGHHDCLQRVPPEAVVQAALDLLAERSAGRMEAL